MDDHKGAGGRIRDLRRRKDWTLEQLAREAGVSKGFLSAIENEKNHPTGKMLLKLARALGASVDYLLSGETNIETKNQPAATEVPPELAQAAMEKGWSFRTVNAMLQAREAVLARRSKSGAQTFTRAEWEDFHDRLAPYLPEPEP